MYTLHNHNLKLVSKAYSTAVHSPSLLYIVPVYLLIRNTLPFAVHLFALQTFKELIFLKKVLLHHLM